MASWPYSTPTWRRLRVQVLRAEGGLCRACRREGRLSLAYDVDHITPLSKGGAPFDMNNLQPLCRQHHNKKINCEEGGAWHPRRDRAVDAATGKPLDPKHWWHKQEACQAGQEQKISASCAPGTGVGIAAHTKRFSEGS